MVYGNFFINGAGIRVKEGQNHSIVNNYFDTGDQFSINIQNHHFDPVDTVIIANNTIVNHGDLILGGKGDYPPKYVLLANNLFSSKINSLYTEETNAETWIDNVVQEGRLGNSNPHIKSAKFELVKNEQEYYSPKFKTKLDPYKVQKRLNIFNIPELDDDFKITKDIMKQSRGKEVPGCYVPSETILSPYANKNNTGPDYLQDK